MMHAIGYQRYTTTNTTVLRLSGFCLGLPKWAGTIKVKPIYM